MVLTTFTTCDKLKAVLNYRQCQSYHVKVN